MCCLELEFIIYIRKDHLKHNLMQTFNNNVRYFDDLLALNNDDLRMYNKVIYLVELNFIEAITSNEE